MDGFKMLFYDLKAKAEQQRDSSEIIGKFAYDLYVRSRPDIRYKTCLDIGIGNGWAMHSLLAGGCSHCDGVDISNERLRQADDLLKAYGFSNYTLSNGDAEDLVCCPSEHYDYVNYLDVLEHLPNFERGIQQVYRVLKDEGLIYIKTTNNYTDVDLQLHHYSQILLSLVLPQHISPPSGNQLMLRDDVHRLSEVELKELTNALPEDFHEHIHQFYPDELRDFVVRAGFEVVNFSGTPIFSDIIYNNEAAILNLASAFVALMETPAYQVLVESLLKDLIAAGNRSFDGLPANYVFSDNMILVAKKVGHPKKMTPAPAKISQHGSDEYPSATQGRSTRKWFSESPLAEGWPEVIRLFPTSEIVVPSEPEAYGFYELELPDAFRWMKPEAKCWLPADTMAGLSSPVLLVTASTGSGERFLSISVDGDFLETQRIDRYGTYYFAVPAACVNKPGLVEIAFRVDRVEPPERDPRLLGLPIYALDVIDLNSGWDGFEERRYLGDQVRVFRATDAPLSTLLDRCRLGPDSLVLDVGAGMGWSTALLAATTGARVFGVDLYQYDAVTGDSFRSKLVRRLRRHLPVLIQEPGCERFQQLEQVVERCAFFTMDAQDLLFREGLFDFVFSLNALGRIPDPGRVLQEIARVLKPGGTVFLQFNGLYFSDAGHHLYGLTDRPWIHLLHDRAEIKQIIREAGKAPNEVDHILDTLNGYSVRQYLEIFAQSDLEVLDQQLHKGFAMGGSEASETFTRLRAHYSKEDLTTSGMTVILRKAATTSHRPATASTARVGAAAVKSFPIGPQKATDPISHSWLKRYERIKENKLLRLIGLKNFIFPMKHH
jgi:ubiquinone/menaquinone biosynthesis C-methylase UbiE